MLPQTVGHWWHGMPSRIYVGMNIQLIQSSILRDFCSNFLGKDDGWTKNNYTSKITLGVCTYAEILVSSGISPLRWSKILQIPSFLAFFTFLTILMMTKITENTSWALPWCQGFQKCIICGVTVVKTKFSS